MKSDLCHLGSDKVKTKNKQNFMMLRFGILKSSFVLFQNKVFRNLPNLVLKCDTLEIKLQTMNDYKSKITLKFS